MSDSAEVVEPTSGERLRLAREAAGLTVGDVAAKLKLSSRQVSAIEAEEWSALPERTFTRGFFRSYARLLGVDEKLVDSAFVKTEPVDEMRALHAGIGEVSHDNTPARMSIGKWGIPVALLLCLAIGIAWFVWHDTPMPQQSSRLPLNEKPKDAAKSDQPKGSTPSESVLSTGIGSKAVESQIAIDAPLTGALLGGVVNDTTATKSAQPTDIAGPAAVNLATTAAPAAPPSVAPPTTSQPSRVAVAPGQKRVNLVVTGRSWAEIRSRGEVVASETISDSKREFALAPPMSFVVGNASNVRLTIDDKPYDFSMHVRNEVARFRVE